MKFKILHHHIFLTVTLVCAVICGILMPHVNVNSDMTKYLPDGSQMKQGLEVLSEEFSAAELSMPDVRVMFTGLTSGEGKDIQKELAELPDVSNVTFKSSQDGTHTLYEITVPKSVDQKKLGKDIREHYGENVMVETSQDGATPPISVLIIAAAIILLILFLMSKSWIEPILFMISTGIAIVLNIGTNAFLPSVSITTNYIVAILQLVLSLDYSIVMMNRYRQEKDKDKSPLDAVNSAIPKARTAVISSATTTVVGLLMLCFMKLKIGMDMGIVLAKGVVFSLICTFTVLPSLILLFSKALEATLKKKFRIPTGKLSRLGAKYKILWTTIFLVVFFGSMFLHSKTPIRFSSSNESLISNFFPKKNTVVLIYDNDDEAKLLPLADSIKTIKGVESIISYPTILQKKYTAEEMASAIPGMADEMGDMAATAGMEMDQVPNADLLSPEVLKIAYYMKNADDKNLSIAFPELADFIMIDCLQSPFLADLIDDDMREKIELLRSMTGGPALPEEPEIIEETSTPSALPENNKVGESAKNETAPKEEEKPFVVVAPTIRNTGEISVVSIMPKLDAKRNTIITNEMARISDTTKLNKKMNVDEMSLFIGSTPGQTKMAYSFAKTPSKTLTPIEYVHFLYDDLFHRKALASMVSAKQKEGLHTRIKLMDYANANAKLSAADIASLVAEFGEENVTEQEIKDLAFPPAVVAETKPQPTVSEPEETVPTVVDSTLTAAIDSTAAPIVEQPKPVVKKRVKTKEEIQAEIFEEMMYSGKTYTSAQMSRNLKRLGQDIDPSLVDMLYTFYASVKNYDDSWTMTIEELIGFVADNFMEDPRFDEFIDDETRSSFGKTKEMLAEGVGMLRSDKHSVAVVVAGLPDESEDTYAFINKMREESNEILNDDHYMIGESVMFSEMKNNFNKEMNLVTWLTVIAIFIIVALTFQSFIVPLILVMTVMCGVFVNVVVSGIGGGSMLYLAYLIVQSILMGATIDYGILFTNYYKEKRKKYGIEEAVQEAYKGSINTIMTSGLIMVLGPGVMSLLINDATISAIVGCLSVGAAASVLLILLVLPGLLAAFDGMVVGGWSGRKKIKDII